MSYARRAKWLIGLATIACVAQASAEGVAVIEDFEDYQSGVGAWAFTSNGINVSLALNNTGAIGGQRDLRQVIGANLLGGGYVIANSSLDATVPASATHFRFKHRSLIGLNVAKTAQITIIDQDNVEHVSPAVNLQLLQVNDTTDYSIHLATFTPEADDGVMTKIKGVEIAFNSTAAIAATETLDDLRLTWDNSSVADWSCY